MARTVVVVYRKHYAAVYNGRNGADIAADIPCILVSDDGTVATFLINRTEYTLPIGGALIYQVLYPRNVQVIDIFTETTYEDFWDAQPGNVKPPTPLPPLPTLPVPGPTGSPK